MSLNKQVERTAVLKLRPEVAPASISDILYLFSQLGKSPGMLKSINVCGIRHGCCKTDLTVAEAAKTSCDMSYCQSILLLNFNIIRQFCFPGLASWFRRQPASIKAAVVISAILVFSLIITGLVYCCKKRKAPAADVLKVKPPTYDEATTTKTKVPLKPLINEED